MQWEVKLCRICGSDKIHVAKSSTMTMCGKFAPGVSMMGYADSEHITCRSCAAAVERYKREHGYYRIMDAFQERLLGLV